MDKVKKHAPTVILMALVAASVVWASNNNSKAKEVLGTKAG